MDKSFIIKGDICYSKSSNELKTLENSYLICKDGISQGVYESIPEEYRDLKILDYTDKLIMPGLVDLHVHAPQYTYRGLGMDLELLDWLNTYTFPHEARYSDIDYAKNEYQKFVNDLVKSPTTRTSIFATLHLPATIMLMDMLESSGLISYVGKVNMDRNGIESLEEKSARDSKEATRLWLENIKDKYQNTSAIITPRFIPSCTDELMASLSDIQKEYELPIQSHLSENQGEIAWVKELSPDTEFYGQAYDKFDMFGSHGKTIMAHCVYSDKDERELLKDRGVYIAHCPNSNINLSSGIAPARRYLDEEQNIGLGSDVAGGIHLSIFKQMSDAIQVSKLYWRLVDQSLKPLNIEEAFYLGTLGGGSFFGKVGSFDKGYEFDAIVVDDRDYRGEGLSIHQRLERTIYMSESHSMVHKYVRGRELF